MTAEEFTKPGVFPHIPAAIYHQIDGASSHRLGDIRENSPAHCLENILHPKKKSDDFKFGDACHLGILSPAQLASSYIVAGQCEASIESGKNKGNRCSSSGAKLKGGKWFCGSHLRGEAGDALPAGCELVDADQWKRINDACGIVRSHETIREMLDGTAEDDRELTLLWEDEETGLLCKARIDALMRPGTIYDLKSAEDASDEIFGRAIETYRYYAQAAMYLTGAAANGIDADKYFIIPFEKTPYYGVGLSEVCDEHIQLGYRENRVLLRRYAKCKESGIWPGYAPEPRITRPSDWLRKRIERLEQTTF